MCHQGNFLPCICATPSPAKGMTWMRNCFGDKYPNFIRIIGNMLWCIYWFSFNSMCQYIAWYFIAILSSIHITFFKVMSIYGHIGCHLHSIVWQHTGIPLVFEDQIHGWHVLKSVWTQCLQPMAVITGIIYCTFRPLLCICLAQTHHILYVYLAKTLAIAIAIPLAPWGWRLCLELHGKLKQLTPNLFLTENNTMFTNKCYARPSNCLRRHDTTICDICVYISSVPEMIFDSILCKMHPLHLKSLDFRETLYSAS